MSLKSPETPASAANGDANCEQRNTEQIHLLQCLRDTYYWSLPLFSLFLTLVNVLFCRTAPPDVTLEQPGFAGQLPMSGLPLLPLCSPKSPPTPPILKAEKRAQEAIPEAKEPTPQRRQLAHHSHQEQRSHFTQNCYREPGVTAASYHSESLPFTQQHNKPLPDTV